ncbi:MAG: DUF3536 domain-containing protein [Elusimicrobia bacterium]|nr:DUF3536 domain-containing protein [Elusimicrobiota bacterium]
MKYNLTMKKASLGPKKFLAIHAHFYQPPRENPWTGEIPPQGTAFPYNDWNERIARECYIPNAYARINDSMGRTVELVNNYEYLSFNFGPTLLAWFEKRYPVYYSKIIRTAAKSRETPGRSNAIAQAYNHVIMPLASFNDRLTQVMWGLADFERRFGFKAEAMWLPETAADENTLRLLIDQGLSYAILSPYQAEMMRPAGSGKWTDISSGDFDTKRPYIWFDRSADGARIKARSIALFFYDGPLSKAVAFEDSLRDSETFAARLFAGFDPKSEEDQLLAVAVDGETFGHHHKFADLTLAHAFRHEFKKHGLEATNFAAYLAGHPPQYEAEIKKGPDGEGTAWSCAHGLRRWKGGCDCGREGAALTNWRMPLRAALNWLAGTAAEVYAAEGSSLLKDIWRARNDYINFFTNPGAQTASAFFASHAARPLAPEEKTRVLKLLEIQKDAMFMFTSCGWFFSDISRIEAIENLKYAAKAAAALEELGFKSVEKGFTAILELAPSNYPEFKNGRKIYERHARTSAPDTERFAALRLMGKFLFGPELSTAGPMRFSTGKEEKRTAGELTVVTGEIAVNNSLRLETRTYAFLYARYDDQFPLVWFAQPQNLALMRDLAASPGMDALSAGALALKARPVSFEDFSYEGKAAIIRGVVRSIRHKNRSMLAKFMNDYLYVFEKNPKTGLAAFNEIKCEIEIYAAEVFEILFDELSLSNEPALFEKIFDTVRALKSRQLGIRFAVHPLKAADCALNAVSQALAAPSKENLDRILKFLEIARYLGLADAFFHLQNGLSEIFAAAAAGGPACQVDKPAPVGHLAGRQWAPFARELKALYEHSDIIIERFSLKLDELAREKAKG